MDFHKFYFDNGNYDSFASSLIFAFVVHCVFSSSVFWQHTINTTLSFKFYVCELADCLANNMWYHACCINFRKVTFETIATFARNLLLSFTFGVRSLSLRKTKLRIMYMKCWLLTAILSFIFRYFVVCLWKNRQ